MKLLGISSSVAVCLILCVHTCSGDAEVISMRIVDEPTSYSWQQNNNNNIREVRLQMRVAPSPFSGPEHLKRLFNKCYTKTIEKYEYQFCPFSNLTQKEVGTNSWNPYQGILGIWQEWTIKDNHFTSMMMLMGDQCGVAPRQTEVKLQCGKVTEILSVTEPRHCEYELLFSTPLTCHNHSMLVYPTMSEDLQQQWGQLLGELKQQHITDKGYEKRLNSILQSAGYRLRDKTAEAEPKQSESSAAVQASAAGRAPADTNSNLITKFSNLDSCNTGYESLKEQLKQTKAQLARFL